jgi:hypothetical protein
MHTNFSSKNLRQRDYVEGLAPYGRIILKYTLIKQSEEVCWIQLAEENIQWHAHMNKIITVGFHKKLIIS